jgi:hypothetical protein
MYRVFEMTTSPPRYSLPCRWRQSRRAIALAAILGAFLGVAATYLFVRPKARGRAGIDARAAPGDTEVRPEIAAVAPPPERNGERAIVLAGAGVTAIALGYLVAVAPDLLHFQPSTLDIVVLIGVLGFGAVVVWRPAVALVVLILVAYLNLSDILVRWHGAPSVLQALRCRCCWRRGSFSGTVASAGRCRGR